MFKVVIFDWDGTLADTKETIVKSYQKVLSELGCIIDDNFIERRIGIGTRKTLVDALRTCNILFNEESLKKLIEKKVALQTELFYIVDLIEGAIELLDALYGRTKIGLATMSSRKIVDKLLTEKKIKKYFDIIVAADQIHKPKPNPEIFLVSAAKLDVNPKDCVIVEDSIFGVRAAKAAGMKCVAIPSGAYTQIELSNENPDLLVSSLIEKEKILNYIVAEKSKAGK